MRFIITILAIAILAGISTLYYPWWSMVAIAFLVSLGARLSPGRAFLAGFLAVSLLWFFCALFKDISNEHILSARMAKLFSLPHYMLFLIVAAIVGGLMSGLGAWSGAALRKGLSKQ